MSSSLDRSRCSESLSIVLIAFLYSCSRIIWSPLGMVVEVSGERRYLYFSNVALYCASSSVKISKSAGS